MHIRSVTPEFAVTSQISPGDLPAIAAAGYRAIVCNRPDQESAGQPPFAAIKAEAARLGLDAVYIPVAGLRIGADQTATFDAAFERLPKPILAYCRSGNRSSGLWSISQSSRKAAATAGEPRHASGILGAMRRFVQGGG